MSSVHPGPHAPSHAPARSRIGIEIAVFVAVVVADALGYVPLTQTIVHLPLVWVLLWLDREPWSSIGWRLPAKAGRAVALGAAAGVAMELFAVTVSTPLIARLTGTPPNYSHFAAIRGSLPMLLLFLALSWTLAAVGEEVAFRGFLMRRIAQLFGESRAAWIASLVLSSALFGWGHTEQGISGWLQEGLASLMLGGLFLWCGRSLLLPIVAHGVSNTVAFGLIYLGRYPGMS